MATELYVTGLCPHCSLPLDFTEAQTRIFCPGCSSVIPTSALRLSYSAKEDSEEDEGSRSIAESITSAEAGLIYADNFCESYDWADFAENTALSIPRLDAIAESAKIKFSSDYLSYVLDFKRLAVPFLKKIEGLEILVVELAHKYTSDDISDLFEIFDLYSSITKKIDAEKDGVAKLLGDDIRFAKKFGAPAEVIGDLERSLEHFISVAGAIKPISDIDDIEEYKKVKLAKDGALVTSLRERGIDAEKTYEKAIQLLEGGDVDNALHLLTVIYPYRDTAKLMKQHTGIFSFGKGLYELGKSTYVKKSRITYSADGTSKKSNTFSLFEVKNGITSGTAALTDISSIIGSFGTKIFFIRNKSALCCYDTTSEELYANVRVLDEADGADFVVDEEHFAPLFSADKSCFYIRKKLHSDARRGFFTKKDATFNTNNNFSLLCVNMDTVGCKTELSAIVDVMDYFDGKIFYSTVTDSGINEFRMLNTATGRDERILSASCDIHNVCGDKIIYSTWAPNEHNVNLYVHDSGTGEDTLIAKNASGYYSTIGQKLFYTVGSGDGDRLVSVNLDGTESAEVMENSSRIILARSGWIYYKCGEDRNACLKKVSIDGKFTMLIADRFSKLLKMSNGYVYYIGRGSDLCMARCDGDGAVRIAKNIRSDEIIIDDDRIYYIKEDSEGEKSVSSLYSTLLDGSRLTRLCYDVSDVKEYTSDKLYVCRNEIQDFMVTTPINKKQSKTERVSASVSDYCSFDKKSGESKKIATLGAPEITYTVIKTGFIFRKKKRLASTVTPVPRETSGYARVGIAMAGQTKAADEIAADLGQKPRKKKKK